MGWFQQTRGIAGDFPASWDDLRFPANASNPIGAGTSTADFVADRGTLQFGGTENEYAAFQVQMPHTWAPGTPIYPHVHWMQQEAGQVNWFLEYQMISPGETVVNYPEWTEAPRVGFGVFPYVSGWLHQITPFAPIDMTGRDASVMLNIRLARLAKTAPEDTMSAQAEMLEFDIHYVVARPGTIEQYPGAEG